MGGVSPRHDRRAGDDDRASTLKAKSNDVGHRSAIRFGRTGALFASERYGIEPDLIVTAKSLGGGLPLAAVTGKAEIMDAPGVGGLGGTFAGNPLSCAAALAVLDLFERENLLARANELGDRFQRRARDWQSRWPTPGLPTSGMNGGSI